MPQNLVAWNNIFLMNIMLLWVFLLGGLSHVVALRCWLGLEPPEDSPGWLFRAALHSAGAINGNMSTWLLPAWWLGSQRELALKSMHADNPGRSPRVTLPCSNGQTKLRFQGTWDGGKGRTTPSKSVSDGRYSWGHLCKMQSASHHLHALVLSRFSCVWFSATLRTGACQALLSMGFSRQEYWSGLSCVLSGDFPDPAVEPISLTSPALAGGFFTADLPEKPSHQLLKNSAYKATWSFMHQLWKIT